jgi:hypothetical protein
MTLLNHFEINTLNTAGIELLYQIFENDFIRNRTFLAKQAQSFQIDVKEGSLCPCPFGNSYKPEKFWHVVTRDKKNTQKSNNPCPDPKEKLRAYDKARAKRIHWIKILIDHWQSDPEIVHFYQTRSSREDNLLLWHKKEKFLVIIRRIGRANNRYLVSSYVLHDTEEYRYDKQLKEYLKNAPTGMEWF